MTPVAASIHIAELEHVLFAGLDLCDGDGNLACHEFCATAFGFVVKEDTRASEHAVTFTVVLDNPVPIQL